LFNSPSVASHPIATESSWYLQSHKAIPLILPLTGIDN
jgi:hypothetical protein